MGKTGIKIDMTKYLKHYLAIIKLEKKKYKMFNKLKIIIKNSYFKNIEKVWY